MNIRMKSKIFIILIFASQFLIQIESSIGQLLDRQQYNIQLQKAIDVNDTIRVSELIRSQRIDAIRFIESLLDSAVVQTVRNEIIAKKDPWLIAKMLSDVYFTQFGDDFYIKKTDRYSQLSSEDLGKKAELIAKKQEAKQTLYQGNFKAALELYQQMLKITQSINDIDEQASTLGNIGVAYFYLGDFDTALDYYQKSLKLLENIGDRQRIGNRLGNIGNIYSDRSEYATALTYFDRALEIRQELDDKRGMAADFNNTGLIYFEMGDYIQALDRYQQALALNDVIKNKRSVSKNLANIANVHLHLGNYAEAIQTYQKAIVIRKELGDRQGEGNDLGNLGIVYLNLGEYNKASSHFQQALLIHRETGYREGEAYQLGRIADLCCYKGDYTEGLRFYGQALHIHHEMGHARGEAYWLEAIGKTYAAVGDYERAQEMLQRALDLHIKIEDLPGQAIALNSMGQMFLKINKVHHAKKYFDQALELHRNLGEKRGECLALDNLGITYSLMKDSVQAVTHWNKASELALEIGERRIQGWLYKQLGDFYREHFELESAAQAYEQGLAITERLVDPELRWQLYLGQGRLNEQRGNLERAYYSYRAAIEDIETIRSKASIDEFKSGIMHDRFEVYEAIVFALVEMNRFEEAFEYSERARARSLLDQIGNAAIGSGNGASHKLIEKEQLLRAKMKALRSLLSSEEGVPTTDVRGSAKHNYRESLHKIQSEYHNVLIDLKLENPEYSSLVTIEPVPVKTIQSLLDDTCVLLEYFISDDQIIIFVLTNGGMHVITVPEGRKSLRGKIILFQGAAVQNMDREKLAETHWIKPLQALYKILVEPIHHKGLLAGKKHLIIVSHDLLHYIPFQVLISDVISKRQDSVQPRFLIDNYFISYTPSASVLKYCCSKKSERNGNMLLLAPKIKVLPLSEREVIQIEGIFGDKAEYRLGDTATETLFKQQSHRYGMLHVATTAHFNKANPLFSRLDLAPSEADDGGLDVYEIFGLKLNANLVTLSACQTALGSGYTAQLPQGDDFVSLTRAFLYAGTSSVISSLWEVYDTSTALFMHRFYQHLKTTSKVEALALTQREMISGHLSGDTPFSHPYFWATFVLVGDWGNK